MGAAMFGPLAERNIKLAAFTSSVLLVSGLMLAGIACSLMSLWLLYLGGGVLCGISEGCGYVTPNKNMMLWFPCSKHKGLLTAISIFTFGLGSSICAWLFGILFPVFGIGRTFIALAIIYAIPMFLSVMLIQKPKYALIKLRKQTKAAFSYIQTLKDRYFQKCWLFMFLNISMGLILIGSCASFLSALGFSSGAVITLMMLCAAICIVLIHAGYGSAFACLPGILSTHYGKDTLSQRHGFCLTSWGMASLMAFLCSTFILKMFKGFLPVMVLVTVGYALNILVSLSISRHNNSR